MRTRESIVEALKSIPFYSETRHPEYMPFVGDNYERYRVLHIGESHYIPNKPTEWKDDSGVIHKPDEITLNDFEGWWNGEQSENLAHYKGWYNTRDVVKYYLDGYRRKGHGIFTNTLKSFCNSVIPDEAFETISTANSQKYNYFAFMNFYQMPSIYEGKNYTEALYWSGERTGYKTDYIDSVWYKCMEESVSAIEAVIDILEPRAILITSAEVWYYYCHYGKKTAEGKYIEGGLTGDSRIIHVDHPGSSWWNRKKQNNKYTSKETLEMSLKDLYG